MQLPFVPSRVLPNTDGRGYGVFVPDEPALHWLAAHWWEIEDDTARQSLLMVLYENYLAKHISADDWVNSLKQGFRPRRTLWWLLQPVVIWRMSCGR